MIDGKTGTGEAAADEDPETIPGATEKDPTGAKPGEEAPAEPDCPLDAEAAHDRAS